MQESLGHKLRLMRAERGLSLREAARQAGVVKETISDIERGHTHPYDVTLAKLAKVYDVPLEELLQEPARAGIAEAPKEAGPLVNEDRPPASELASDTNFEQGRETAARGAALERYKRLQHRLLDIKELE